jgi:hypothetical protein
VDVVTLHGRSDLKGAPRWDTDMGSNTWTGGFPTFEFSFQQSPAKPYIETEPVKGWDGTNFSLDQIRRSVWERALSGAGWVNQDDASFGWNPKSKMAALRRQCDAAYACAGHCCRFFNQSGVAFWEMTPRGALASTGICLVRSGVEYVIYAPDGGAFTVDLTAAKGKTLAARWYDPRKGEFHAAGKVAGGDGVQKFTSPLAGDAVLHLITSK